METAAPTFPELDLVVVVANLRRHLDCLAVLGEQLPSGERFLTGADVHLWLRDPRKHQIHALTTYLLSVISEHIDHNASLRVDPVLVEAIAQAVTDAINKTAKNAASPTAENNGLPHTAEAEPVN